MPIEYEIASLDGVEESLRGAYEHADEGKFKLNIEKYGELRTAPLHAKNKQLLDEKKKLDQSLKSSQSAEERVAGLEKELLHFKLTTPLRDIILKAGAFPNYVDLILLEVEKRFALDDYGQIQVLDERGNPTSVKPEEFFDKLYKEQRGHLFQASTAGGSGAPARSHGSGFASKIVTRAAFEAMSSSEQMAFSKSGGTLTD